MSQGIKVTTALAIHPITNTLDAINLHHETKEVMSATELGPATVETVDVLIEALKEIRLGLILEGAKEKTVH